VPALARGLAEEVNEIANQRIDNVKFALNKKWFAKRGVEVDLAGLVRNVPGGVVMMNDPINDVREISWPDVTQSSYMEQQGLDMGRVRWEDGSRTTRENAQQVAKLLGNRCKQPWLLVTSAWHMPRSMAEFEAVCCNVTPYPVVFRTGDATPLTEYALAHSLLRWQTALHEWLGMLVYRLTR
jgi:uncharacterized SAM-binding protein YcdF (DUF218 family)